MSKRVLVLSPHPDDDAIGCGGTLCQHVANGDHVRLVVLTSGEAGGHGQQTHAETIRLRESETLVACRIIGIQQAEFWREPDGNLQVTQALQARLRDAIEAYQPDFVYATHAAEMHPDHRATTRLLESVLPHVKTTTKPVVRLYEVWTPIQDMDEIIDISEHVETKRKAIQAHKTQIDAMRLDEAAIALNRYRGEMHSWPGGDYAEVFQHLKS